MGHVARATDTLRGERGGEQPSIADIAERCGFTLQ
jgi:hypothetical protein